MNVAALLDYVESGSDKYILALDYRNGGSLVRHWSF